LRAKRTLHTELTDIPGIGQISARKLLQVFGSVQAVREAPENQLIEQVGVNIARRLLAWRESGKPTSL
jgi:excinuclease ABC subunit C